MTLAYGYYFEALYQVDQPEADQRVITLIRQKWPDLLREQTQTTAEGFAANNVGGCSSLHNFGAIPAYYLSSYVLGVRSEGPREHRRLIIQPRLGDLQWAKGTVMSQWGPVSVEWRRFDRGLEFSLSIPTGKCACVALPSPGPGSTVELENQSPPRIESAGRWIRFAVPSGMLRGRISCSA